AVPRPERARSGAPRGGGEDARARVGRRRAERARGLRTRGGGGHGVRPAGRGGRGRGSPRARRGRRDGAPRPAPGCCRAARGSRAAAGGSGAAGEARPRVGRPRPGTLRLGDRDRPDARRLSPGTSIRAVKGVILAGGSGSRLAPLTRITNKHLLPLYDRPMVTYAVEALVDAGFAELMLVTGGTHAGEFFRLLGNGHEYGIERLFSAYQDRPGGIAEALGLAERFVDGDRCCVLLADNVFERPLGPVVERFTAQERGARVVLSEVEDDEHLR